VSTSYGVLDLIVDRLYRGRPGRRLLPVAIASCGHRSYQGQQDVTSRLYKVTSIPTLYVIDKDGKIVASFVSYNGTGELLEDAINQAGVS
jgi:hypothetical protein